MKNSNSGRCPMQVRDERSFRMRIGFAMDRLGSLSKTSTSNLNGLGMVRPYTSDRRSTKPATLRLGENSFTRFGVVETVAEYLVDQLAVIGNTFDVRR